MDNPALLYETGLDPGKEEIRILTLHRSNYDEQVCCGMRTISLKDHHNIWLCPMFGAMQQ
jgi:hypothetical protein